MIRPAIKTDSKPIAQLHVKTLSTSFLARLGLHFLKNLYVFLIKKEHVWVYEEKNKVTGFISFSQNSAGMMKRFLISCPFCLLLLLHSTVIQPKNIKWFLETFRAPFKSKKTEAIDSDQPLCGELLSVSVSPDCQATGIGSQLLNALEDYLIQHKIEIYKVIAGAKLISANKFYLKHGFTLSSQIKIHGSELSNVYVKKLSNKSTK